MAELSALTSLPLRARCLADSVGAGRHRSRRRGASVEFADYRDYQPGDDLRRIDWRLLARTDRAHLRQSYEETPLRVVLLLDVSASMNYASRPGLLTKLDYARSVLGALALIVRRQRDACGIGLLDGEVAQYVPPSTSLRTFDSVWSILETPALANQTRLGETLERAANLTPRSCLFVIASDFYEPPEVLEPVARRLRFEGHDVLALHIVDPEEEDFTFSRPCQFIDPETGSQIPLDPVVAGPAYRAAFAAHRKRLQEVFVQSGFACLGLRTDTAPLAALGAYLAHRAGKA